MNNTTNYGNPQSAQTIAVDDREILFIKRNSPTAFARMIADSLRADGIDIDRIKVHKEITTLKDNYSAAIIEKARYILKHMYKLEYNPNEG